MITSNSPWYRASKDDRCFQAYLREGPSYFERTLAISTPVSELLSKILECDVSKRLNIHQIRYAIQKVDSFYVLPIECQSEVVNGRHSADRDAVTRNDSTPPLWRSESQNSSKTNSDSDGPITPETIACDPERTVPGFSLEETCAPKRGEVAKQQSLGRKIPVIQRVVNAVHRMKI